VTVLRPGVEWKPVRESLRVGLNASADSSRLWSERKRAALVLCQRDAVHDIETLLDSAAAAVERGVLPDGPAMEGTLNQALRLCGPTSYDTAQEEREVPWSFIDAVFFCMTVITTIGYGHISPSTPGGQIFCIFYSLLGIPISGLLLAGLSDFFAGNLLNFYDSQWRQRYGDSRWSLAAFTVIYLLMGFIMFVFAPAVIFSWLEDWNYRESVYYAFITLSTIGFGDFTAAIADDDPWTVVYKVFVMLWILVGLGYWVLVLNFLQKTLKSKQVMKTLKSTSRLIAKEADEVRQVLSEVGLLHRDAVFIPEHTKMALNMMLDMTNALAGATPTSPGGAPGGGHAPGIHSIGYNMRDNSLLAALMAAMPPPTLTPADARENDGPEAAATNSAAAADTAGKPGLSSVEPTVLENDLEAGPGVGGQVNAGYQSDGGAESVTESNAVSHSPHAAV